MFRHTVLMGLVLFGFVVPTSSVKGDTPANPDNKEKSASAPGKPDGKEKPVSEPVPYVICAYGVDPNTGAPTPGNGHSVRLGQSIRIKVENLDTFQQKQRADCKGEPCQEKKIHLFLNLMEIKGMPYELDTNTNEYQFRLLYRDAITDYLDNKEQKAVWAALFGFRDKMRRELPVTVSIGLDGAPPLPSKSDKLSLVRFEVNGWLALYCLIMAVILILYGAGFKRGLFSDRGTIENGTPKGTPANGAPANRTAALSLARIQMGFWFFLVVASFLFIWLVIGEFPTIPASVLALIGIASGTALGAAMIDSNKRAGARAIVESGIQKQTATANLKASIEARIDERKQVEASLKELNPQAPGSAALKEIKEQQFADLSKTIEQLQGELQTLKAQLPISEEKSKVAKGQDTAAPRRTFFEDLFSDENGWSFHRVQMGIWTLVLGFVFVGEVLDHLAMPDFDTTLLALMGISSGTYLGFKLPEQQQTPPKTT